MSRKNPGLFEEYNQIIVEQSSPGIMSDVDPDKPVEIGHVIFLLHHSVIRGDKQTTKVRIVYGAPSSLLVRC